MPVGSPQAHPMLISPCALVKNRELPVAVYLRTPTQPPGLDLTKPILLYSHYHSTKVRATSLRPHRDGTLSLVGPSLVIPDTYSGWFSVITPEGKSAPIFSCIEEVVSAKLSFFLTRYDVTAFSVQEEDSGHLSCQRNVVPSGHVLKLIGVIQDLNSRQNSNSNGNWLHRSSQQEGSNKNEKFAQCLNFKNEMVYLPLNTRGRFYATAQKSSKNTNKVFLVPQIIKNFKLPLTVKLVCGHIPRVPCAFTGFLRLERSYQEDVVLSCTMTSEASATLFEMEVASNFLLTPIIDEMFTKSPIYLKTVSYCQDEADLWQRQMKVTHHVTEKRTRSLTRTMSDKFIEPLHNSRCLNLSFLSELNLRKFTKDWNSPCKNKIWDALNDKENKRKTDKKARRLSKQNTYVFQTIKRQASQQFINSSSNSGSSKISSRLSQSVDNLEMPTIVGEISTVPENARVDYDENAELEDHYSVIGEPPLKRERSLREKIEEDGSKILFSDRIEESSNISELSYDFNPTSISSDSNPEKFTRVPDPSETKTEPKNFTSDQSFLVEGESVSVISVSTSDDTTMSKSKCKDTKYIDGIIIRDKSQDTKEEESNSKTCVQQSDDLSDNSNQSNPRKESIQMRGNTVVIKVKDLDMKNTTLDESSLESSPKLEEKLLLENTQPYAFKSTVEFTIQSESVTSNAIEKRNSSGYELMADYDFVSDGNKGMMGLTNGLDSNSSSEEETRRTKEINNNNSTSEFLPEEANSAHDSPSKMGVCLGEDDNAKTDAENKESAICKKGVICDSPNTLQSEDNKTYFCITHDIPKNHIFHTIDLTDLKNQDILQKLTKSIENSKINPIFIIKNEGNVTFNTCTDWDDAFDQSSKPSGGEDVARESNVNENASENATNYLAMKYDVTDGGIFDDKQNIECDSAISVSSDEPDCQVTHI